jgi:Uma2 family endonuclease
VHALANVPPKLFRKLYRKEYDALIDAGFFVGEHIELLFGRLVEMSPIGRPHNYAVTRLSELLLPALLGRAQVRIQCSFAALEDTEPEPDVAIVARRDYLDDHPKEAHLIIEVAETSLWMDRKTKRHAYEKAGIPEYWIVNLVDGVIEMYCDLREGAYREVRTFGRGESLAVPGFADVILKVDDVLPPL